MKSPPLILTSYTKDTIMDTSKETKAMQSFANTMGARRVAVKELSSEQAEAISVYADAEFELLTVEQFVEISGKLACKDPLYYEYYQLIRATQKLLVEYANPDYPAEAWEARLTAFAVAESRFMFNKFGIGEQLDLEFELSSGVPQRLRKRFEQIKHQVNEMEER